MNLHRTASFALILGLVSCSSEDGDATGGATAPPASTTTSTTTSSSLVLTTEGPPTKAGIEARVKAEVDGRTDGITGTTLVVPGASLQTAKDWTTTKGDVTVVASPDKKAQLAATSIAGAADAKLPAAATALGLAGCEWNPADSMLIGKTALPGSGADGLCTKGPAKVKAAYVAAPSQGLLVVVAWEDGGDAANLFGALRSITRAAGGGSDGIAACCAALRQNANSAPPDQKGPMLQAALICDGLRNSPQGKAALGQIRGMLKAANMPSACK